MKKLLMVSALLLVVSSFGDWGEVKAKEPCPFDWLGIVGMPFAYGGGATMVYGLTTWSNDNGKVFYYGLASAGTGLLIGLIADLANLPCKRRYKEAGNASMGSFGDIGCMVVDHVQMTVSPDGKQGYAGLRFDF